MAVRSGDVVNQIAFFALNSDRQLEVFGPFGGTGGTSGIVLGEVRAFYGRAANGIDQIGVKGVRLL